MQNLANATFFPEPKVAFGKDPLYSKGAGFDGYPGRASSSMPQKLYFQQKSQLFVQHNVFYNKTSNNNSTLAFKLNCSVLKCKKTRTEFCQKKKSTNESIQSPGKLMKLLRYLLFLHFLKVILKELQKLAIDVTSVGHYGKLQ